MSLLLLVLFSRRLLKKHIKSKTGKKEKGKSSGVKGACVMDYTCYISLDGGNKTRGGNEKAVRRERERDQSSFINSFFAPSAVCNGTTHLSTFSLSFSFSFLSPTLFSHSLSIGTATNTRLILFHWIFCGQEVTAAGTFLIMQLLQRPVSSLIKRERESQVNYWYSSYTHTHIHRERTQLLY